MVTAVPLRSNRALNIHQLWAPEGRTRDPILIWYGAANLELNGSHVTKCENF